MIKKKTKDIKESVETMNRFLNEMKLFNSPIQEDEEEQSDDDLDGMLDDIADDEPSGEETDEEQDEMDDEMGEEPPTGDNSMADMGDMRDESMGESEVEIDVSSIVDGIETNNGNLKHLKASIDLMGKNFNNYLEKISNANQKNSQKIEKSFSEIKSYLDKELRKRVPTPDEKFDDLTRTNPTANSSIDKFFGISYDDNETFDGSYDVSKGKSDNSDDDKEYVIKQKDVDEFTDDIISKHSQVNNTPYSTLYNNMLKLKNNKKYF